MKKRLLAFVLVLCMMIVVFPVPAQAAATYDASAAVSYAANHWNDGVGLCAEFVSNCLKAGGCSAWSASCFSLFSQLSSGGYGTLQELSINSDGKISVPAGSAVSPGDPVFIYCGKETDGKPYVHVYLCAGQDSSGYLTGYAHNKAWDGNTIIYKKCSYCGNKVYTAYAFHMSGSKTESYTDPNNGDSASHTTFNASAAVAYASDHWNDGVGLCAEFVSNCLKAGGCPAWSASCLSLFNQLSSGGYGTLQQLSINSDGKISVPAGSIVSPGDPVFIYCAKETDGKPYVHVYLCAGQDSSGYLMGYAHNKAWGGNTIIYRTCSYCGNRVNTAYTFHMNGSESGTYTVTFDPNGGSVPFTTKTVPIGTALSGMPTPTFSGYKFCGWTMERIDPNEKGVPFTVTVTDGAYAFDENTTLYAFWEKERHIQGDYLFYEAAHPHLNYFACTNCGEAITDGSTVALNDCDQCNHPSGIWSGWYDVIILPLETDTMRREVETRQIESTGATQYRYRDLPISPLPLPFSDVNTFYDGIFKDISGWYYENVAAVYRLGLMRGVGDSRFAPDDNVTIAEAVTMAARMHNIYYGNGEKFEPYDGGNWYDPYVNYVKKNGLLAENYDYNKPATREQFAHILACAFPNEALAPLRSSSASFADAGSIVYRGDVNRLYMAGVINGSLDGGVLSFKPQDTITRAEAAAIVTRMAKPELRVS